ncbi:hypothetical protein MJO28_012009 [Puccinia striiformis f. sp. tritici]|uniref:Uncharacterized protein n=1 Tax=Puccinia striiformis f. sp. tritici TaxID=168172 RepID=A0ACC0DZ15_9BASI|nr:hypothetical protein MJO28_012009 [Puccinia striiformis f. sp. tritici]
MNALLSDLNNTEKDTFWEFRERYEKYSAIGSITPMTDHQAAKCRLRFRELILQSPGDQFAYASMHNKIDFTPAAKNNSRRANHKEALILFSNFKESEINIYFKALGHLMNDFHKEKRRTFYGNLPCGVFGK